MNCWPFRLFVFQRKNEVKTNFETKNEEVEFILYEKTEFIKGGTGR